MGEIRKDNLHESLIEELNELANIDLSGYQEKTDENLITESKDLVGAINELFQNANNGKELIANAIGEPVSADDTFSAMSNDINGLLSTFKTNMMNNGVTVEAGDKFKSLIDKIANMAEEGEGKGIQFAEGTCGGFNVGYRESKTITINTDFRPQIIFIELLDNIKDGNGGLQSLSPVSFSNNNTFIFRIGASSYYVNFMITNITDNSFDYLVANNFTYSGFTVAVPNAKWYAIGVGEDDTTLLDSLKSILAEEGVTTTEEDDMASLITKVDTEFTEKNNEAEDIRSTLAGLMQEGGYDITGNEDINNLLGLLTISGIKTNDIKQIACNTEHTFILKNDGSLWGCGRNSNGQLGLGSSIITTPTFQQVTTNINNDVKQVACGDSHTFIVKNDGSLWSCGRNNYGQLGLGSTSNANYTFTKVTTNINNDVKQVACGDLYSFIVKNDGSLWSTGYNNYGALGLTNPSGTYTTFQQVTTNINNDVKQVSCGKSHTMVLKNDGSLWSTGWNNYGQLGLGVNSANITTFTQVTTNINNDVKQVSCGYSTTFIVKNDGSLWSCGCNYGGPLGLGTTDSDSTTHNKFQQVTTNINNDVKQVICGVGYFANGTYADINFTYILKNDGSIWACGYDNVGQLGGIANGSYKPSFTLVSTADNIFIACGYRHAFILKNDGSLWVTGTNTNGQLGLGDTTDRTVFNYGRRPGFIF